MSVHLLLNLLQKLRERDLMQGLWSILSLIHIEFNKGALAIRRIFSLVDMIIKPKFSNCPNVFKIGLFR